MAAQLPPGIVPRLLTHEEAAAYCRLGPKSFDEWVRDGRLPTALPRSRRWDRAAIDAALDRLSGLEVQSAGSDEFEAWRAERRADEHAGHS